MKLVNFTLDDINNETLATDNDYARIRIGLLRDLMLSNESTEHKLEVVKCKYKLLEEDYEKLEESYIEENKALSQSNNKLYQKLLEVRDMELIQRKRAIKLKKELDAVKSIKLDIRG